MNRWMQHRINDFFTHFRLGILTQEQLNLGSEKLLKNINSYIWLPFWNCWITKDTFVFVFWIANFAHHTSSSSHGQLSCAFYTSNHHLLYCVAHSYWTWMTCNLTYNFVKAIMNIGLRWCPSAGFYEIVNFRGLRRNWTRVSFLIVVQRALGWRNWKLSSNRTRWNRLCTFIQSLKYLSL